MIVGFSGWMKSGKDTAAKIVSTITAKVWYGASFAANLKACAGMILNVDSRYFSDQNFKENYFYNQLTGQVVERSKLPDGAITYERPQSSYAVNSWVSIRVFLQDFGSDLRIKYPDIWVSSCISSIRTDRNTMITDVRFQNEADAIKKIGGIVVRVDRQICKPVAGHISETALDNYNFDHVIDSNKGIPELKISCIEFVKKYNL